MCTCVCGVCVCQRKICIYLNIIRLPTGTIFRVTINSIETDTDTQTDIAQSTGAVEYTDCTSAEMYDFLSPNKCPEYDTKQSDGEVPVKLGLWGMRSTPSLPLLPGSLRSGVVASDRALSMD